MPEGGTLTLRTRAQSATAWSSSRCSDTGVGMDEDTRRRCLEPFFTTKGERGTGLGLAMVYGMVQRHGAEIEIDSAPGSGTTVRLAFPTAPSGAAARAAAQGARSRMRPLRILVVDDDPLLLRSRCATRSRRDGHTVDDRERRPGRHRRLRRSATKRARPFDVVITDLGMPYVDGRQVAAAIKADVAATPVILLTGWGQRLSPERTCRRTSIAC